MPQPPSTNTADPTNMWQTIGQAYCISLVTRQDRTNQAVLQFKRVGLENHIHIQRFTADPTNSERGIYQSHQSCLHLGLQDNARTIAVFEDDITFRAFSPKRLEQIIHFLDSETQWDVLFLGCFVKSSWGTQHPGIRGIRYQCTAHGYIMSPDFARRIAALPWEGKAYDDVLRDLPDTRYFALYPAIAYQSDSPSDNAKTRKIDRMRRLMGGMARLQRLNEYSRRHLPGIIAGHVISILILTLLAWWLLR